MGNEKLRAARQKSGLSQEELARRVSVTRQTIILIEKREYNPSLKLCTDICKVLGLTLDDIFWEVSNDER